MFTKDEISKMDAYQLENLVLNAKHDFTREELHGIFDRLFFLLRTFDTSIKSIYAEISKTNQRITNTNSNVEKLKKDKENNDKTLND